MAWRVFDLINPKANGKMTSGELARKQQNLNLINAELMSHEILTYLNLSVQLNGLLFL